jgi:hypothetical protein
MKLVVRGPRKSSSYSNGQLSDSELRDSSRWCQNRAQLIRYHAYSHQIRREFDFLATELSRSLRQGKLTVWHVIQW